MCSVDDAEPWEFFKREDRKSRRDRNCDECGRVILAGEVHEYARGKAEGCFSDWRICVHCMAARTWLVVECGGSLIGGLADELWEHWRIGPEYHSMWLARALVGLKNHWRTKRGQLMEPLPAYKAKAA